MNNWKLLSNEERKHVWKEFTRIVKFRPDIGKFPGIRTSMPSMVFDIADYFSADFDAELLETFALDLFRKITKPGERMYALDWQHDSYDFDPRLEMDRDESFGEWIIPIFPNGDYYIFLTKDFSNIWFGHPWEKTITLIGDELIKYQSFIINEFETMRIHFNR